MQLKSLFIVLGLSLNLALIAQSTLTPIPMGDSPLTKPDSLPGGGVKCRSCLYKDMLKIARLKAVF